MKCPKCGYLGFERVERCRNCGYEFSLVHSVDVPELAIRTENSHQAPSADLSIAGEGRMPSGHTDELPLFGLTIPDDEPLITKPSPPRAPLAVRRSTPDLPRRRPTPPRAESLDLDLDAPDAPLPSASRARNDSIDLPNAAPSSGFLDAPVSARLVAVAIDVGILAVIDAIVVYFTMQICGVSAAELALLPKIPLSVFLLGQNVWYLVAFTVGGQTLGKMAMAIKVVPATPRTSLDVGRAVVRELTWLALAVPAGLGFVTVLGSDHRGLHDRLAGTRVVR